MTGLNAPSPLRLFRTYLLTSVLFIGMPASALATTTPDIADIESPDAIVVTGNRNVHDSIIQATPASITALNGDQLERQGISNIRELGAIAPNLFQTRTAVSYANTNIFIRGVDEPDAQGEPSTGIYVDGIYVPKNLGSQQELLDIEQVDIYRGPQGQAFGHSTEAGAVVNKTITPDSTSRLKIQAAYGNYNDTRLGIAASGPLGGDLFGGVALSYHRRDGFNRNVTNGRDTNNVDYFTGRAKLRYAPNDGFDVILAVSGVRDRSTVRGVQDANFADRNARNRVYPYNDYDQLAATLTVNYAIDDHLSLHSISAAYGFDQKALYDNTGDYWSRGSAHLTYKDRTYQEELQVRGDYGRLDFVSGLYFYRELWLSIPRRNVAANNSNNPATIRYAPVYSEIQQNTTNLAAYTEAHLALNDRLRLTAGIRYNWEHHSNANQLYYLSGADPVTHQSTAANSLDVLFSDPGALVWSANVRKNWGTWAPKGSIDFEWRPGFKQYVTISQGTKSGGFDYRAATPGNPLQAQLPYNPEKVTNYEGGFKTEWLNGQVQFNISGFYMRFDDIQLTTTDISTAAQITRRFNAGKGSTRGAEAEATVQPTKRLQFDLSGSYLDARLDEFYGRVVAPTTLPDGHVQRSVPFAGATLPYAPKWQGRFSASWNLPLPTPGNWTAQAAVQYQSSVYTDATNNFTTYIPSQAYIDAQVGYTTADGRWSAVLSAKNIANKHYAQGVGYALDNDPTSPTYRGSAYRTVNYNDPRTIFLTVTFNR